MIKQKDNTMISIEDEQVASVRDTYNDFMKNVLIKDSKDIKLQQILYMVNVEQRRAGFMIRTLQRQRPLQEESY